MGCYCKRLQSPLRMLIASPKVLTPSAPAFARTTWQFFPAACQSRHLRSNSRLCSIAQEQVQGCPCASTELLASYRSCSPAVHRLRKTKVPGQNECRKKLSPGSPQAQSMALPLGRGQCMDVVWSLTPCQHDLKVPRKTELNQHSSRTIDGRRRSRVILFCLRWLVVQPAKSVNVYCSFAAVWGFNRRQP